MKVLGQTMFLTTYPSRELLRAVRSVITSSTTEAELFDALCRYFVQVAGYRLCWVGQAQPDEAKSIQPIAVYGEDLHFLDTSTLTWGEAENGQEPTGIAIRTGTPSFCHNIPECAPLEPWQEAAMTRSYAAALTIPILIDTTPLGAITLYSSRPNEFIHADTQILLALIQDISDGIKRIRYRLAQEQNQTLRKRAMAALQKSLGPRLEDATFAYLANYDQLTGLPNRALFLEFANKKTKHLDTPYSILTLQLDSLATINETYGYPNGDSVLAKIGKRIVNTLRDEDIAARIGGDQFAVIYCDANDEAALSRIANRLIRAITAPISDETNTYTVGVHIGIGYYPDHSNSPERLLELATIARHHARRSKKSSFTIYDARLLP